MAGLFSFLAVLQLSIDPNDDSGILEGNSVAYAINDWIPIYNFEDGNMAYLDYSSQNSEKEPRVIMAFYNGNGYEIVEILAEDLGDFTLKLVQEQLEAQKD